MSEITYGIPVKRGPVQIQVVPELIGLPWNNITEGYLYVLRPTTLRVVVHGEPAPTDDCLWRVTVIVHDVDGVKRIAAVHQEVEVGLSQYMPNGYALITALYNMRRDRAYEYKPANIV